MASALRELLDTAERAGATRYYQTPSFGTVTNAAASTPQPIRFTRPGYVVAMYGQVNSGAASDYAATSLRVQIGGTEDLFVDGQGGPAFAPFLALFGGIQNRQALLRRVVNGTLWTFTVQTTIGGGGVVPLVTLSFLDDQDVQTILSSLSALKKGA